MNELQINIDQIQVVKGLIVFDEYESLKQQALELASNIEQVEVTEENIKVSKKLLSAVNKRVKEMEDKRISIKKEMLEPYNQFESQVKEIVNIVKDADALVRNQVRELEEQEREAKRNAIAEIFQKRIDTYFFSEMFKFEDFLKPQHLNKTTSMNAIEMEMVEWLERIEADILVIQSLPNAEAVLTEYYDTKNLATAMQIVNDYEALKKKVNESVKPVPKKVSTVYNITLQTKTDLMIVEMFLQLKDINYSIEKVEI